MVGGDDLDAAWENVPSSPRAEALDPVEQLKRIFRGAIAANPSLWRSVDLDDAVLALDEAARARPTPLSPIALEPIKKRLVKMHAPKTPLLESFLAFADEARAIGVATIATAEVAELDDDKKKTLLKGFYARLNNGGLGASTRHRALAGELVILLPPTRSAKLAQGLAVALVMGLLVVAVDDRDGGDRIRPAALNLPDDGVSCAEVQALGRVIRCVVDDDDVTALRARPVADERAILNRTRAAVLAAGYADALMVDRRGLPISPRSR